MHCIPNSGLQFIFDNVRLQERMTWNHKQNKFHSNDSKIFISELTEQYMDGVLMHYVCCTNTLYLFYLESLDMHVNY